MTDDYEPPRPTRQIQVQYHDNPQFTTAHGDDCVLLIRHRPDNDLDDAFVLTPDAARELAKALTTAVVGWFALQRDVAEAGDLSPDQFRDDEDDA